MLQMRNRGRQINKLNLTFNSEQPKDRYKLNTIYSTFSMSSVVGKKISVKLYPNDALKLQKERERSLSSFGTCSFKVQRRQNVTWFPWEQI